MKITFRLIICLLFTACMGNERAQPIDPGSQIADTTITSETENGPDLIEKHGNSIGKKVKDCDIEGSARKASSKKLNRFKNRMIFPMISDYNNSINLAAILAPGNDKKRWNNKYAARITAYICKIKSQSPETCNCSQKGAENTDTHIELVLNENECGLSRYMVAEITPRIRRIMAEKGIDWTTDALIKKYLHKTVNISGWMMFDTEHPDISQNTHPGRKSNGRATAWEIHPVVGIELVR